MAASGAAPRRRRAGPGLHRRADRLHLQRHLRRRAARGRAVHGGAWQRLLLVPVAHSRRPHQSLRPRDAPDVRLRLQAARRPTASASTGRSATQDLAPYYDKAERFIGVTGTVEGIRSAPDGIFNPPGALKAHEVLIQESCAQARHPRGVVAPGGHHCGEQRPAAVPLLRPVRPRLHDRVELRGELRPDLPGDEDRQGAGRRQRHGARADHRCQRQGHRRLLHRQDHRQRAPGAVPDRRAGRQLLRIGAAAAQFQVVAPSPGTGELLGQGRPLPDGHGRLQHVGDGAGAVGHAALQHRRLRLASLRAVVDVGKPQGAEFPARLPHRSRRRLRHARHRLLHRRRQSHRRLRRADEAGDPRRVRHVGRAVGPGRDDSERGLVLRNRSRP